ncbi:hypothetical protein Q31b_23980 [Novipirellula aureliae]|uniref:DUF1553 domain-containing protein n=1 Tax=Novipirellula aureliae TaxID=2527966 RepID=A0A5C6E809_9BACT|nr:DUF1553 domain-containing protein [Novipirellula aureliae]TWU43359.1 hypothetical protein Q31b_23980 [Novipirellula aureliae]
MARIPNAANTTNRIDPLWIFSFLMLLTATAIGVVLYNVVSPVADSGDAVIRATSPAVMMASPTESMNLRNASSFVPSKSSLNEIANSQSGKSLAAEMPKEFSDLGEHDADWINDPFESDLPIHSHNSLDDLIFLNLINRKIEPAKLCSDAVFLRRVYIDTLGTLPTADEARSFLDDTDPDKRNKLIDTVLEREEFSIYLTMRLCDLLRVKAEFPINLWPNAAQAYHRWIHQAIRSNMPADEFAHRLLTSSGSNFRTPQVNFYRAMQSKEPKAIAQTVALTFLCERAEKWPDQRLAGMAQFFSQVGFKPTGEWKEEIVYFDPRKNKENALNQSTHAIYPNGVSVNIPAGIDPRIVFADWLTDNRNPWFARAFANRIWYWLMNRGIVDPPDDIRPDNPPSNHALLNQLADEFVAANYDIRFLYRLILRSNAYQLSCIPQSNDSLAGVHFAYHLTRRHDAEVLIDGICQITDTHEMYMSIIPEPFTFLPDNQRAIALPDGSITSSFLETFGRPARDSGLMMERNNELNAGQALHLLNSNHIRNKLKKGQGINRLLQSASDPSEKAELLYLAILSRRPSEGERTVAEPLCRSSQGTRDLAWALINTDEFIFQH